MNPQLDAVPRCSAYHHTNAKSVWCPHHSSTVCRLNSGYANYVPGAERVVVEDDEDDSGGMTPEEHTEMMTELLAELAVRQAEREAEKAEIVAEPVDVDGMFEDEGQ